MGQIVLTGGMSFICSFVVFCREVLVVRMSQEFGHVTYERDTMTTHKTEHLRRNDQRTSSLCDSNDVTDCKNISTSFYGFCCVCCRIFVSFGPSSYEQFQQFVLWDNLENWFRNMFILVPEDLGKQTITQYSHTEIMKLQEKLLSKKYIDFIN